MYKVPAWNRIVTGIEPQTVGSNYYGVFDYDAVNFTADQNATSNTPGTAPATFSFTNVAAYTMDDDSNVTLKSASQLSYNQNGEQMYRVGASAAIAAGSVNNDDPLAKGTIGTKDELIAAYAKEKNVNETVAKNDWWNVFSIYTNGQGIYPVYKVDYVQLEKQGVKANTVHYTIDEQYDSVYNTWSNNYVNATVDTEFYIVMPNGVQYKMGFAELPTIAKEKVRAAYAVATNTNANASGRDYWVADVIVIEVDSLEYSYDSISLMYYNPRETSGSVRYVNSLNNEWRALQPDSDEKAKITVIPDSTNESGAYTGWGNTSWSTDAYGFYTLYNTEMDENNDLVAADAQMITKEWNSYGIYAGTIQRTERLVKSGYIDVDTLGRTNLPEEDKDVLPFFVGDAPFYRVTETSASDITLTPVNKYSDVQLDDEVIIVYNKAKNTVAYVVDLGYRKDSYTAPSWLLNDKDYQAGTNNTVKTYGGTNDADSLYCKILWEQQNGKGTSTPIGDYTVTVKAEYTDAKGVAQTATLKTYGVAKNGQLTTDVINTLPLAGYTIDLSGNIKINGSNVSWTSNGTYNVADKFNATVDTTVGGAAGVIYITGINTDIEIVVPFDINENDISANVSAVGYGVNSVTTEYTNTSGTKVGPISAVTGQSTIPFGTKVTIAVGLTAPLATSQTVTPSVVKDGAPATVVETKFAGVDSTGKYLYTFDMPDFDVLVSAKVALPEYTVTVAANNDIASTDAPAKTDWTANLVVTPTAKPGFNVTGATVTDSNGNTVTSSFAMGAVTVTAADGAGKNVTITFTTEAQPAVTTVDVAVEAGYTPASIKGGTKEEFDLLGVWPTLADNSVINLNGATTVTIFVEDAAGVPVVDVDGAKVAGATTAANTYGYIINGLTGGETITISAPLAGNVVLTNPATGADTAGVANTQYAIVADDPSDVLAAVTMSDTPATVATALEAANGDATVTFGAANTAQSYTAADDGKYLVAVESTGGKVTRVGSVQIVFNAPAALTFAADWVNTTTGTIDATKITNGAAAMAGTANYIVVDADPTTALADIIVLNGVSDVTTALTPDGGSAPSAVTTAPTLTAADTGKWLVVLDVNGNGTIDAMGAVEIPTIA